MVSDLPFLFNVVYGQRAFKASSTFICAISLNCAFEMSFTAKCMYCLHVL
jgi:hypothetical protein